MLLKLNIPVVLLVIVLSFKAVNFIYVLVNSQCIRHLMHAIFISGKMSYSAGNYALIIKHSTYGPAA